MRQAIEDALAKILALEEQKLDLIAPYQQQIAALQASVAAEITTVEQEQDKITADLDAQIARFTALVMEHGVEVGETVKVVGLHGSISSVYFKPSYKWEKAKLLGFAAAHPELMTIAEEVPASVQIRRSK
jgi:hypothetical protein